MNARSTVPEWLLLLKTCRSLPRRWLPQASAPNPAAISVRVRRPVKSFLPNKRFPPEAKSTASITYNTALPRKRLGISDGTGFRAKPQSITSIAKGQVSSIDGCHRCYRDSASTQPAQT